MDVDEFLRGHQPPAVSVDTESALAATLQRGRAHRRRRIAAAGALVVGLLVITGFAVFDTDSPTEIASIPGERTVPTTPEDGDAASWKIDPAAPPSAYRDSFRAWVTRMTCNGGRTGPVLRPGVVVHDDRIEVTFTVGHVDGPATCPGNLPEAYDVDLGVPIGDRRLVDGRCNESTSDGEGGVIGLACFDGGVKWAPPATNLDEIIQRMGCERVEEAEPDTGPVPQRTVLCGIGDRTFGVAQYRDVSEVAAAFASLEGDGIRVLGPTWIVSVNTPEAAGIALSKVGGSLVEIGS
jgi:hypothetical protein